jgi:amidase
VAVLPDAETAPVDSAIRNRVLEVADFARRQGATVSVAARPDIDLAEAHEVFIHLLRAATSRSLSDDGFARNEERARTTPASSTDYESWMLRGSTLSHRDWLACNERRQRMRERWAEFFRDWDVMLCPAAATTAFPHDQKGERWERMITVDGKSQPSTTQMFWAGYSGMAYLPSTVAPVGLAADGLPVGVQIIGPLYGDLTCIEFAGMLERDLGGFSSPPDGR